MTSRAVAFLVAGGAAIAVWQSSHSALAASQPRTVWGGVYTDAQAKRGMSLYQAKCARCHAAELTGKDAPPLKGTEFNANWNDLSLNDLFERIRIGMPADEKGTLTPPQVADLLAALLQAAEMPAGTTEVPTEAAALKDIKYLATKP